MSLNNNEGNDKCMAKIESNAIPALTDNTNVIFSGAFPGPSYYPFNAFDAFENTYWLEPFKGNSYLGYKFPKPIIINKYKLYTDTNSGNWYKAWTFEGSNDNKTWTVLDTQTGNHKSLFLT